MTRYDMNPKRHQQPHEDAEPPRGLRSQHTKLSQRVTGKFHEQENVFIQGQAATIAFATHVKNLQQLLPEQQTCRGSLTVDRVWVQLFRKDLISAMKLPDSEPLDAEDYWFISDGWKQEWERGVQVPVNPGHLPEPTVKVIKKKSKSNDFKLPPNKYLRLSHDEFFSNDLHVLTNVSALAEKTCRYDLDCLDQHWLRIFNEERKSLGLEPLPELAMEMILEDFETQQLRFYS
ncbi:hypothetical protein HPB51_017090 [Rhipicephalus microplus]|uniref:Enhancer of polycomb-like N-terminal domain-containing protein n=1 Tax=Rhipicephalus microplus TaxID=6941 RepID=A0A9J6F5X3_RHIMP|nr:hypothetical protein HPB51_017090 [Rhipicephalus microplus]